MAKAPKETTFLVSSAGTGYFYTIRRNKKKNRGDAKVALKKYDPLAGQHVLFEEKKLSPLKKKFQQTPWGPNAEQAGAE
ncbi:MAG: 50S ribosomal protein L33 [Bdellovibrionales bacterium]|nr:50S ribosomal protein L33 [Bdellovibrionales bacterium]